MRNIRLKLAYDGTDFRGWQVQPNGRSVQAVVEKAIARLTGETVRLIAAGRTDSGVHATGQVANWHTSTRIPCERIRLGLQSYLPDDVLVRAVDEVPPGFHARYSARRKRYRYVLHNGPSLLPFLRRYVCHYRAPLDLAGMQGAAELFLGTHDFRCFETQFPNRATSVRTVHEATVTRQRAWPVWTHAEALSQPDDSGEGEFLCFDIVADGFLYNMVRAMAGTLMRVGRRRWSADDVQRILTSQDRAQAGDTAPACGLYLVHVEYEH